MMSKENILAILWYNNLEIPEEYLPSEFFEKFEYVLDLCRFIDTGWATSTNESQEMIDFCWDTLCAYRDLDPNKTYESIEDFMKEQVA